ncbi:glycosyltransferase [Mycobacterium sp. NPDC006124]|uniref:glycosyltransferase n=1 Tax=Mycobacterium sp. NPDC006124 TaxID=3156729 RepID=UPI0033B52020
MGANLAEYRLVYVANANGVTAVGDYAENLVRAVRPHFGEVVECRTGGPGDDTVRGLWQLRKQVVAAVAEGPPGRVLVHAELSAGALAPFWSTAGLNAIPTTATIHDPPQGVWWPARTAFLARHRLLMHGLHYPLRPLSRAIEGAVSGRRTLFALTETGRRSIQEMYPHTQTHHITHLVAERPRIRPAQERPKAVGFFGMVYRGKGFEQIARIRAQLPSDVVIRIAGRGTESLPRAEGIEIVGGVDGPDEDAFFESIRAVVVPYGKRHFYADTYPASGVVAHATAYRTPVVCTAYGSLAELDETRGALVVKPDGVETFGLPSNFASELNLLISDSARLTALAENSDREREANLAPRAADAFAAAWSRMLGRSLVDG